MKPLEFRPRPLVFLDSRPRHISKISKFPSFQTHNQSQPPDDQRLSKHFKNPLKKLSIILEASHWNLMEDQQIKTLFLVTGRLLDLETDMLFPLVARLHTNFIKHIWMRLCCKRSIPISRKSFVESTQHFTEQLFRLLTDENAKFTDRFLIFCSFLDLCLLFQPANRDRHEIFKELQIKLKREIVHELAMKASNIAFESDQSVFRREMVLISWIRLCQHYESMPHQTASEQIIRHYTIKSDLKQHLEILMEHLMSLQKNIFEQTVAFAILHLATKQQFQKFKAFHQALEKFLSKKFDKKSSGKLARLSIIASFIISKLKVHIELQEGVDRLMILIFLGYITKNIDPTMKQKVSQFSNFSMIYS